MNKFKIKAQNGNLYMCDGIIKLSKSSADYRNNYWICRDDKVQTILGCYDSPEKVNKIMDEIFESDGTYIMPKNK